MELVDQVARLQELLDNARERRGLPRITDNPDTEGLAYTLRQMREARAALQPLDGAPYPVRRKHLLARIAVKLKHYGYAEEVQLYVTSCGHESLYALDVEELEALCTWLARRIDDAQHGYDWPDAPAAR